MAKKTSNFKKRQRVERVVEWLLEGHPVSEIIKKGAKEFGLKTRSIEYYVQDARLIIGGGCPLKIQKKRDQHLAARWMLLEKNFELRIAVMGTDMAIEDKVAATTKIDKVILDIKKDMANLQGLYTQQVKVVDDEGKSVVPNVISLPPIGRLTESKDDKKGS